MLGRDLLNEPIPHFPELREYNPQLETLCQRIVAAIREVDKNHIMILGGAWITQYRELLDKNHIDWAFWPYKKMDGPRSAYGTRFRFRETSRHHGDTEQHIAKPPSAGTHQRRVCRVARQHSVSQCAENDGYLKALGLKWN